MDFFWGFYPSFSQSISDFDLDLKGQPSKRSNPSTAKQGTTIIDLTEDDEDDGNRNKFNPGRKPRQNHSNNNSTPNSTTQRPLPCNKVSSDHQANVTSRGIKMTDFSRPTSASVPPKELVEGRYPQKRQETKDSHSVVIERESHSSLQRTAKRRKIGSGLSAKDLRQILNEQLRQVEVGLGWWLDFHEQATNEAK
jgi:hypothetical protein